MPSHTLEVWALGEPSVRVDGTPIPNQRWESRHCLSLLILMLEHWPRAVDADLLLRTLWPLTDTAKGALHATVSRLRKPFPSQCPPVLVFQRGLYRLSEEYEIRYDVAELDRLRLRASQISEERLCQEVLHLLRGPFMAGYQDSWVQQRRNHLELRMDPLLQALSSQPSDAGQRSQRVQVYQRLLEFHPCLEAAHRGLVLALVESGQAAAARAEILQFEQALVTQMEAPPSSQLRQFWRELVSGS